MPTDFQIGRVVSVDTSQVTIELSGDVNSLSRATYEGSQEIGVINSYVILPVTGRRLVAILTRVLLTEEAELRTERTMIVLPSARRLLKATLIGTIEGASYTQGVSLFPVLDNPVHMVTEADLSLIFDTKASEAAPRDAREPGYCIRLGDSPIFSGYPIQVDPDRFFGKHAAVLGSTGSGKSCTIASLIQSILERPEIRRCHFVILDTNGEYASAFPSNNYRTLCIPSDSRQLQSRLVIPYWFLNADDFVRLFRAAQGVQRPVLLEALRLARNDGSPRQLAAQLRDDLLHELNRLWSVAGKDEKTSKDVRDLAAGLLKYISQQELQPAWGELEQGYEGISKDSVTQALGTIKTTAERHIDSGTYPKILPADARSTIRQAIDPIESVLTSPPHAETNATLRVSADSPAFFDKNRFRNRHIEQVLRRDESGGLRARDFAGTMLLRIDRLLDDRRFDFLLGPVGHRWPDADHILAAFIRDILGLPSGKESLSATEEVPDSTFPFYDRQRQKSDGQSVVIVDLSLLAAEVLENVTALIGRLILEFLQRLGESASPQARGSLPVVLVLEEAQNYVREHRPGDEESISRMVFERIAREGRKFGLGLVVSSQRPSELSKTVLSQCSTLVVHRLQNPEDLRYFREIVPAIYGPLLEQLPALAPQTALVVGEGVRAPALVRIRDARPVPRSQDPKFYAHWVAQQPADIDVEDVCASWSEKAEDENIE